MAENEGTTQGREEEATDTYLVVFYRDVKYYFASLREFIDFLEQTDEEEPFKMTSEELPIEEFSKIRWVDSI